MMGKMMKTNKGSSSKGLVLWVMLMLSNNLILPVISTARNNNFGDEKNFYFSPTDPVGVVPSPPSGFHSSPSHSPSPSGSTGSTTPHTPHHHASSSGHHGSSSSSSSGGSTNCSPSIPTPTTPPTPSGGSGGGYYPTPSPAPPRHYDPTPRHTPSPPASGGGCKCPSPPPPPTSSGGSGGGYYGPPTPSSPLVPSPPFITPVTPIAPSPPLVPISPSPFDPNTPPFPCNYWGNHPTLIFGVVGWWATVGGLFGVTTLPGLNSANDSLQEILKSPRKDGYGSLYREATASFLNSMAAPKDFPYSTNQVRDGFLSSLSSDKAAAHQARLFKLANEGKHRPSA